MDYFYGYLPEASCPLEICYLLWQGQCKERFEKLKANEEELNRIFIDIYGSQEELTPEVDDKDITVRKADLVVTEVNTRESRYAAWKNAMIQANKLLNKAVDDANSDVRLIGRPEFLSIIDRRRQATKFYRKEYKSKRNMKFPYDD